MVAHDVCPRCGCADLTPLSGMTAGAEWSQTRCLDCDHRWGDGLPDSQAKPLPEGMIDCDICEGHGGTPVPCQTCNDTGIVPRPPKWRVTFGQKYRHEPHPVLGFVPTLPDQFVTVEAVTEREAREKINAWLGSAWAFHYPTVGPVDMLLADEYAPLGEFVPGEPSIPSEPT